MSSSAPSPYQPKRVLRLPPLRPSGPSPQAEQVARTIEKIVKHTKTPFGEPRALEKSDVAELEKALHEMETELMEHEAANLALQTRLADQERNLRETEALLMAREEILQAERHRDEATTLRGGGPTREEAQAHHKLKLELDAQEETLKEAQAQLHAREERLQEAEAKVLAKLAELQQRETALEKREAELKARTGERN